MLVLNTLCLIFNAEQQSQMVNWPSHSDSSNYIQFVGQAIVTLHENLGEANPDTSEMAVFCSRTIMAMLI